jgi:hypothetical protein
MRKSNDELTELLQTWKPEALTDTGFTKRVWSRIEATEFQKNALSNVIVDWIHLLLKPKFAIAAVAIAILAGVSIGGIQARVKQEDRYLFSLNPFNTQPSRS